MKMLRVSNVEAKISKAFFVPQVLERLKLNVVVGDLVEYVCCVGLERGGKVRKVVVRATVTQINSNAIFLQDKQKLWNKYCVTATDLHDGTVTEFKIVKPKRGNIFDF
jgi:hypothetical protein